MDESLLPRGEVGSEGKAWQGDRGVHGALQEEVSSRSRLLGRQPQVHGQYCTAVITKNVEYAVHPEEDRFLNIRELMHLMGLPHDFEIENPMKNWNHVCQNVPVSGEHCDILAKQVIAFCRGELNDSQVQFIKQDNIKQTVVAMERRLNMQEVKIEEEEYLQPTPVTPVTPFTPASPGGQFDSRKRHVIKDYVKREMTLKREPVVTDSSKSFGLWESCGMGGESEAFSQMGVKSEFDNFPGMGVKTEFEDFPEMGVKTEFEDFPEMGVKTEFEDFPGMGMKTEFEDFPEMWVKSEFEDFPGMEVQTEFEDFPGMEVKTEFENFPGVEVKTEFENFPGMEVQTEFEDFPGVDGKTEFVNYPGMEVKTKLDDFSGMEIKTEVEDLPEMGVNSEYTELQQEQRVSAQNMNVKMEKEKLPLEFR